MRLAQLRGVAVAVLAAMSATPAFAQQGPRTTEIKAGAPVDVSVTVYRNPNRGEGGFELDNLGGFALITETRRVVLPPGEHKLRFEGVADGIEAVSAIVTGLPSGVIEKNRDAMLLSPSALVASAQAQGGRVQVVRTNPETGVTERVQGTIRTADASSGVVFETSNGVEALRCSGLPETFDFDAATTGLVAVPTLSVLTRVEKQTEAVVQLSYLSRGFDWAADYTGDMRPANKMDIGAWITLANGNSVGFPNARVQIVAGRLNRETGEIEPIELGQPILAQCWPQGSTSDFVPPVTIERAYPLGFEPGRYPMPAPSAMMDRVVVTGSFIAGASEDAAKAVEVIQEELGDLKLYRVPDRATISSRQSKQVRMMDRAAVPVTKLYEADFYAHNDVDYRPATILLRTKNDSKNKLGLPLPSGRVALFETTGRGASAQRMLAAETGLRDLAVNEEVELRLTGSPDVQVRQIKEEVEVDRRRPPLLFLPGVNLRDGAKISETSVIEITNARAVAVQVEVRLQIYPGHRLVKADRPVAQKNGRPIFRVTVPANGSLEIRYQTASPPAP